MNLLGKTSPAPFVGRWSGLRSIGSSISDAHGWAIAVLFSLGLMAAAVLLDSDAAGGRLMLWAHGMVVMPVAFWASLTLLGSGWAVVIIVAALDRRRGIFVLAAMAGLLLGGALVQWLKKTWLVARPSEVLTAEQINVIGDLVSGGGSMPSGHAAVVGLLMALVIFLLRSQNRLAPSTLAVVLTGGGCAIWSRVAVGAHWPADVLVGAAIGILTATVCMYGASWAARSLGASVALSQRVKMTGIGLLELLAGVTMLSAATGQTSGWLTQAILGCIALVSCAFRMNTLLRDERAGLVSRIGLAAE